MYLPPLLHLQKKLNYLALLFLVVDVDKFLFKTDKTTKKFHVCSCYSSHCIFNASNSDFFFHFTKLITFECLCL